MPYNLLSEPIRHYLRDKRWKELRPIQAAAISKILTTDFNYILASGTASGKTEAAFLPILSTIDKNAQGIQVLYISPLIALINDQLTRIEDLCKYIGVPVTKWHGEASLSTKNKILNDPKGIMLITPESLEAMFVTRPYNVVNLFSHLQFIIIDEIHSFIGTNRGIQLKSILSRLQEKNNKIVRIIGLSATIGDYTQAKQFTGNEPKTKVLLDKGTKPMLTQFRYYNGTNKAELPLELIKDLYKHVCNNKTLIFPNSRGLVEEIAVKLKKISEIVKGHNNFFVHHSSINKDIREHVEFFAKNNRQEPFSIVCTSTLELGIDIGTIDEVIQIDSTHSVSSMIQRVGRSGRRDGACSKLMLYATTPWNLLQALACWNLHTKGYIEPPEIINRPYDILVHQILSIIKEHNGIDYCIFIENLLSNFAFSSIKKSEILEITQHLIQLDFIEKLNNELILGIEGEKIVNNRNFYSTFEKEFYLNVIYNGRTIGELPYTPQIAPNNNILLSAKIWKIIEVDLQLNKIYVDVAKNGLKPIFLGSGNAIHKSIHHEMFNILVSNNQYEILDNNSKETLQDLRKIFTKIKVKDIHTERIIIPSDNSLKIFIFSGTKVNRTLKYLLEHMGFSSTENDNYCSLDLKMNTTNFNQKWKSLLLLKEDLENILLASLRANPYLINFTKWGKYLPDKYKVSLIKEKLYDFDEAFEFIEKTQFIYMNL